MKITIGNLGIEVTRRCNIQCKHCLRGTFQKRDISLHYIDTLLDQVGHIKHFCPTGGEPSLNTEAIQYFIDGCKKRGIVIDTGLIFTNGVNIKQDFIDVCNELNNLCEFKFNVILSNDKYHTDEADYDETLLSQLPFYSRKYESDYNDLKGGMMMHKEGLATIWYPTYAKMKSAAASINVFTLYKNPIYLNVEGSIINGCDWSYNNQNRHKLCRVESISKYYKMKHLEEDWERLSEMDQMYVIEKQKEIEEEWQQWEEEQQRKKKLPAKIIISKEEYEKNKTERRVK